MMQVGIKINEDGFTGFHITDNVVPTVFNHQ